jgi:HD-GYP domain-containing protein (c-di-GMP phosphodiesterase class II)
MVHPFASTGVGSAPLVHDQHGQGSTEVRLSEVIAGLSTALDLTEGQRPGHSVRSCAIGMRLTEVLGLSKELRSALFYALLMKDLGCSSNASHFATLFASDDQTLKTQLSLVNWSRALESFRFVARGVAPGHSWHRRVWQALAVFSKGQKGARDVVLTRCERGAEIARMIGFASETVHAIRALDEHWDGHGQPYRLKGEEIPLLARVLCLAQTVEIFFSTYGVLTAYDMAFERRGSWFDPALVDALLSIRTDAAFWRWLGEGDTLSEIGSVEPIDRVILADADRLDVVAEAFARVIDAKSPWTYNHSNGVAALTVGIADTLGFAPGEVRELRRAALLHDIGKLGVSNLILDKPDKLTDTEFEIIRRHPAHTEEILGRVGCFRHLAELSGAHHERLDGTGYHRRRGAADLTKAARLLSVADMADALLSSRPYRPALTTDRVVEIMAREVGTGLDPECFGALKQVLGGATVASSCDVPAARIVPALATDCLQAA